MDYELYCEEHQIPAPGGRCPECGFVLDMQSTYLSTPEIEAVRHKRFGSKVLKGKERKNMKTFIHPVQNKPVRLGKAAPRLDDRNLKLADYLKPKAPAPPGACSYMQKVQSWPMYLNDQLGDCVIAAAGHMVEQWTEYASTEVSITDTDVLKGYEDVGGYVPGDPSTDNGCVMLTALNYWRKTGFGGHKIAGFVALNPTDPIEIEQAIYLFGNAYLGVALPISAQNQTGPDRGSANVWAVPSYGPQRDGSPGSWGGHCIPAMEYNGQIFRVVTWGGVQQVTWNFLRAYCDEAYAVLSPDWIESNGISPSRLNVAQLNTDLSQL